MFTESWRFPVSTVFDAMPSNARRHSLDPGPNSREALSYVIQLPEDQITVIAYTAVDASSVASAMVVAFGDGVEGSPVIAVGANDVVGAEMGFHEWSFGSIRARLDPADGAGELDFDACGVRLALSFLPVHGEFLYSDSADGCPPFIATDRVAQGGFVTGSLELGGVSREFACPAHHEHSWGSRDWGLVQHYKWIVANVGEDRALHVYQVQGLGRVWTVGYVFKDDKLELLRRAEIEVEFDEHWFQVGVELRLEDQAGRLTEASLRPATRFEFPVDPRVVLNDVGAWAEVDGQAGAGHVELVWQRPYFEALAGTKYENDLRLNSAGED